MCQSEKNQNELVHALCIQSDSLPRYGVHNYSIKNSAGSLPSGPKHNIRWSEVPEYKCLFRYSISTGYLLAVGEVQVWKP